MQATHTEGAMKIAVVLLFVLLMILTPNPVVPDESLATDDARASAAETAETAETAAAADQEEDEEPLEEYVPSQKISADHSVSFPVDI
jgi:hypothetical protein